MKIKSFYHIPLSSLQWLITGLFLSALPLWSQLPPAIIFGFLGCLLWRFTLERKGLKCPPAWIRFAVGVAGLLLIWGLLNPLIDVKAGMGLLLLLIALKVLEMKSEREFMLLGFLGFFILLTSLFFSQTLLVLVYVTIVFLILTATLVQFNGGGSDGFKTGALLRYTTTMVLQALPLIVLFFVFLPRMKEGLWFQKPKRISAQSGMSDQINPGSFAELALSQEIAFRADFPEGPIPPFSHLYWRVAVFTECHGLAWRRDNNRRQTFVRPRLTGPEVVQRISMETHSGPWVYALDRPESQNSSKVIMGSGNTLVMSPGTSDVYSPIRVVSRLGNDKTPLSEQPRPVIPGAPALLNIAAIAEKASLIQVNLSARSWQLVNSWRSKTSDPRALVTLALRMFRDEKFRYTLSPGFYSADGLDKFLFERKMGFCEHYAAAFSTLMRMAGLPARMVAGYHGGELNSFGDYLIVSQADAHAWAEVWIEGEGWVRFDPADAVNPSRIDPDTQLASRHSGTEGQSREISATSGVPQVLQEFFRSARLGWDTVNFQFNLHIISYDQSSQLEFYRLLGIQNLFSWRLITILLGGLLAILSAIYFSVRQKPERRERSLILYQRFCRMLAGAGVERKPGEGPKDFSRRAVEALPDKAKLIAESADLLTEMRYGRNMASISESRLARKLVILKRHLNGARRQQVAPK